MIICYTDANRAINLRWRDEEGNRKESTITDFDPYFYVYALEDEPEAYTTSVSVNGKRIKLEYPFRYEEGEWYNLQKKKLKKVKVLKPDDIKYARKMWPKTYEGDVPFTNRNCVDNLNESVSSKILFTTTVMYDQQLVINFNHLF